MKAWPAEILKREMKPIAVWISPSGEIVARLFDCFRAYTTDLLHSPHLFQRHASVASADDLAATEYPDAVKVKP